MKLLRPFFLASLFLSIIPQYSLPKPGLLDELVLSTVKFLENNSNTFRTINGQKHTVEITNRNRKIAALLIVASLTSNYLFKKAHHQQSHSSLQ